MHDLDALLCRTLANSAARLAHDEYLVAALVQGLCNQERLPGLP